MLSILADGAALVYAALYREDTKMLLPGSEF